MSCCRAVEIANHCLTGNRRKYDNKGAIFRARRLALPPDAMYNRSVQRSRSALERGSA